ncbi:MAG: sigma D regulator [Oleibacter sp.]|nr:sigma D regulator [Thalassolituus sp.]
MLEKCKDAQERWGGVHRMVDTWLNNRQSLIVLFCNLSTSKPLSTEEPLGHSIQRFCEVMIDYCSAGHFEIYEQLVAEAREYDDGGVELANELVPRLDALTAKCVDFNDTYDKFCTLEELCKLSADLSALGEVLEERFQIEDRLIERLHTVHQEASVAS